MNNLVDEKVKEVNDRLRELAEANPAVLQRTTFDSGFVGVGWRPQVVIDTVNTCFGAANWSARVLDPAARPVAVAVRLRVDDLWTEEQAQFGEHTLSGSKAQMTDAVVKALSHFGIARDAYLGLIETDEKLTYARFRELEQRAPAEPEPVAAVPEAPAGRTNGRKPFVRPEPQEPLGTAGMVMGLWTHFRGEAVVKAGEWKGTPEENEVVGSLAQLLFSQALTSWARRHKYDLPPLVSRPINAIAMDIADDQSGMVVDFDRAAEFEFLLEEVYRHVV